MKYPGGKNAGGSYQRIINQIPPHKTYIEGFLGSGAILCHKRPAEINIGIEIDPTVAQSFPTANDHQIIQGDFFEIIKTLQIDQTAFLYLDPPYLMSARRSPRKIYRYEFLLSQHERLLSFIQNLPGRIAISGYASSLYNESLKNWRRIEWQAVTRGGSQATEVLWMNYSEPVQLHDYRFLGVNRTERQQIKRKKERWVKGLENMKPIERYAILSAIEDWQSDRKSD